jgi:hypothetical protein
VPERERHGTRLVFRQGSPLVPADLQLVAASRAGATVIVSDQSRWAAGGGVGWGGVGWGGVGWGGVGVVLLQRRLAQGQRLAQCPANFGPLLAHTRKTNAPLVPPRRSPAEADAQVVR